MMSFGCRCSTSRCVAFKFRHTKTTSTWHFPFNKPPFLRIVLLLLSNSMHIHKSNKKYSKYVGMSSKVIIYDAREDKQKKKWAVSTSASDTKKEPRIRECSFLSYSLIMQPYSACMRMSIHACITHSFHFSCRWREGKIAFHFNCDRGPRTFFITSKFIRRDNRHYEASNSFCKWFSVCVFFYRQMTNTNLTYFNWSDDWITNLEFWLLRMRSEKWMLNSTDHMDWNELVYPHFGIFHSISV